MNEPPDPRSPMTPEEEEVFDKWDAQVGCKVALYCTKAWAERRDFNDLSADLMFLGSPAPDSGHEFWRIKWSSGDDVREDELFAWAQRKALELQSGVAGLDWATLATQLYEGDVAEEARRLFPDPDLPDEPHVGPGLVFFHLLGLIS
jgi:hypothetical protein